MKKAFIASIFTLIMVVAWYVIPLSSTELYTREAQEESKQSPSKASVQTPLLFVGDIMMGRFVETLAQSRHDTSFMFASTSEYLKGHITIANLEGPIPNKHTKTPVNGFGFSFPSYTASVLKSNGIHAVSLSNNHMYDRGQIGYEDTKRALEREGVLYFGGYSSKDDAYLTATLGEKEVVVYGMTMISSNWNKSQSLALLQKVMEQHTKVHVVVFIHWGDEYVTQNEYQQSFAHELIDMGVDTIIGSHPHVVQGVEIYKGVPIFYSLGNFIFDQYWRSDLEDGYMVRMSYDDKAFLYDLVPTHSVRSVPSLAEGKDKERILQAIARQSTSLAQESVLKGSVSVAR